MSIPVQAQERPVHRIGPIFDSSHQTYSVTASHRGELKNIHTLYISAVDKEKNQIILETLDPKKNYSDVQWKDIAKKFNLVLLGAMNGDKVVLSVSEIHRDVIPTMDLEIAIKTDGKIIKLCKVYLLRYFDKKEYGNVVIDYVNFFRFVVAHDEQQKLLSLIKK